MQVTALGHSAGAQLWAMVLLHRAKTASEQRLRKESRTEIDQGATTVDCRMPAQFVGARPLLALPTTLLAH